MECAKRYTLQIQILQSSHIAQNPFHQVQWMRTGALLTVSQAATCLERVQMFRQHLTLRGMVMVCLSVKRQAGEYERCIVSQVTGISAP
jgi:hypothetical protein